MITKKEDIRFGQKLGHIMSFIPTNCIFDKKIPGLGATYLELICKRCSLLIEPNKPVIKEKVRQFKANEIDVLGVYSGITDERIIKYITSSNPYKKIITTPESYILRIKPLMELHNIDLFNEYFMLYDESERTIQDIDYRQSITGPIDDFFEFTGKAMITATPIHPSDPRFEKNQFHILEINPTYDYSNKLHLHTTNNVLLSIKDYIKNNPSDHYCFFLNSTDGILSIIKYLKIEEESQIFCADKSVKKLRNKMKFKEAYPDLRPFKKYNFFTSSFFSAVDIELDFKPDVVILSDLFFAEFSIIDPATEAVQIMGRFRQGFNSLTHISNINHEIKFQTRNEIMSFLEGSRDSFSTLRVLHDAAKTEGHRQPFKEAIEFVSYSKYVKSNWETDWFKIDNKLDVDMVKSYYSSVEHLKAAYSIVKHFKVTHTQSSYTLSDRHRLKRSRAKDDTELLRTITEQLDHLKQNRTEFTIDNSTEMLNELNREHPELCRLYRELGKETMEKYGYKISEIRKQVKRKITGKKLLPFPAVPELLLAFKNKLMTDIPVSKLGFIVGKVKAKHEIKMRDLDLLRGIYEVSKRKLITINGERVWTRQLSYPKFQLPEK